MMGTKTKDAPAPQRKHAPFPLDETIVDLVELAQGEHSSKSFFSAALRVLASAFRSPYILVEARLLSHVIQDSVAQPPEQADFWEKTAQSTLTGAMGDGHPRARMYRGRSSASALAILTSPLRDGGGMCSGAIVAVVSSASEEDALEQLHTFGALATLIATLAGSLGSRGSQAQELSTDQASNLRKVSQFTSATELAFTLTNKLRNREGCELVALGRVHGKRVRILSISGLDEVENKSPGVRQIKSAMEECLDLGESVLFVANSNSGGQEAPVRGRLHQAWSRSSADATVASIPLHGEHGEIVAILSLRTDTRSSCTADTLEEYRSLVEPYASTIDMLERSTRSVARHVLEEARDARVALTSRGALGKKLRVALPLAAALWLLFGKLDYQVTAPCSVAPQHSRELSSPHDAQLSSVKALPGDHVQAGDILCTFDVQALLLEKNRLDSQQAILDIEEKQALATGLPIDVLLAQANQRELASQIELLKFKIEHSVLRAPIDGLVVQNDLRDRVGDVFAKGEPLYKIAAVGGWTVELRIPESSIAEVRAGQTGRFANLARPEEAHELRILRVSPSATASDGKNVFIADAEASLDETWTRSGMEGTAKIDVGPRSAWWVLFHRAEAWLRMNLWF